MSDLDVSKIDVGWRVQFDATHYNGDCKNLHETWGTVTDSESEVLSVLDDLENCKRYLRKLPENFLSALPPEPVKDPFAVGEWVVCVEEGYGIRDGEVMNVSGVHGQCPKEWFVSGTLGYPKDLFRPATPEEIAAHLVTTTPTNTILDRAKSIITGSRQTTNGNPERSFHKIAQRWSLTLGTTVTAQQVALMMVDLKMVRALEGVTTEGHDDHFVDMAGYVALAAELGTATIPE